MSEQETDDKTSKYEIVVNGTKYEVADNKVTYEEVVAIAFPNPPTDTTRYTVTYRGAKKPEEGSLKPGGEVKIGKQGAIFNVTPTVKS
jgi:hypothetical protein